MDSFFDTLKGIVDGGLNLYDTVQQRRNERDLIQAGLIPSGYATQTTQSAAPVSGTNYTPYILLGAAALAAVIILR